MAERKRRLGEYSAAGEADADAAFREALSHARPFIKSDLEWHSGNVQEFPTFMTEFYWPPGEMVDTNDGPSLQRAEPTDPLLHVRVPDVVPAAGDDGGNGRRRSLETIWRLTRGGCKFVEAKTDAYHGRQYLTLDGYQPTVRTAALAAAASRLTVSWVHYDDREDPLLEAVVDDPRNAASWELSRCFADGWPNRPVFSSSSESEGEGEDGGYNGEGHSRVPPSWVGPPPPGPPPSSGPPPSAEWTPWDGPPAPGDGDTAATPRSPMDYRPADLVVYRLIVPPEDSAEPPRAHSTDDRAAGDAPRPWPAELREVVRRALEVIAVRDDEEKSLSRP